MNNIKKVIEESLKEFDEDRKKGWKLHHKTVPCVDDEIVWKQIKDFLSTTISNIITAIEAEVENVVPDLSNMTIRESEFYGIGFDKACDDIQAILKSAKIK